MPQGLSIAAFEPLAPPAAGALSIAAFEPLERPAPAHVEGVTDPASVRVTNPPAPTPLITRGRFTGLPGRNVTSETPEPLTEGMMQAGRGAAVLGRQLAHPQVLPVEPHVTPPSDVDTETLNAASDVLEGAMKMATPLVIAGMIADLPGTVLALGGGYLASAVAGKGADLASAPPEVKRFVQLLAGAAGAAGLTANRIIELGKVTRAAGDRAVAAREARNAPTVIEPDANVIDVQPVRPIAGLLEPDNAPLARPAKAGPYGAPPPAPLDIIHTEPLVDEAGRPIGGTAGPPRPPTASVPLANAEAPRPLPADQVRADLRANPDLVRQADAMKRQADEARATPLTIAAVEPLQEAPNAVQEPSGNAVDVRQQTSDGEAVGRRDTEPTPLAGAHPQSEEGVAEAESQLSTLSDEQLHAIVDHPAAHEEVAHEAVAELMAREEERNVEGPTDERPPVPGDRAPLAGTPPEDGGIAGAVRPSGAGAGVRGPADVGSREQPDSAGLARPAGAGTHAPGVGVPAERSGPAAAPERRPGGLARPTDHVIAPDADLAVGGERTRVAANLAAVQTLKRIEAEQRPATPEEQATLAKYVGWGGLPNAFKETHPDHPALRAALTDAEFRSARASTPNAHYTSPTVIRAVYDALAQLGVRGPVRFLEPAAGVGHFLGLMPPDLAAHASRSAVEMDAISGRITKALYPNASVQVKPFQEATLPEHHFDLVVSNVPFGNYQVADKAFKGRPKTLTSSIHNYYFAKALDLVRPGGIVAFITSRYTLDAQDPSVREYLAARASLLGAVRLPNTAFKQNAGTEVVTDILFLQKKATPAPEHAAWVKSELFGVPGGHHINKYFGRHPEMVLGTHASTRGMHREDEYTVEPSGDLAAQLRDAIARLPAAVYTPATTRAANPTIEQQLPSASAPPDVREHAWFEEGGKLYIKENGVGVPIALDPPAAARVRGLLKIRDTLRTTMRAMLEPDTTDAAIRTGQRALNKAYDTFVAKHGYLSKPKNYRALREDPDVFTLLALEEWAPKATAPEKAAIFSKRTLRPHTPVTHVDTPKEALLVALNETGRVDWPRMAALTGQSEHELQLALEGLVFHDPERGTWEHADRYLSGNVKAKLAAARQGGDRYALNVQALDAVQPPDLEPADIAVRLGAPWIPADVLDQFAAHLGLHGLTFSYSRALAKWSVNDGRFHGGYSVQNTEQWGTGRKPGHKLLLEALNLGDPVVMDRTFTPDGKEGTVVNQQETIAAREKQQAQQDEFKAWIWTDAPRAQRLARLYNDTMNTMRAWEPDGAHLTLPGISAGVTLRPHQKNFIWRGLQQPNALAHHVVGAGKTYAGIALALEKRRMGLARKPMVLVPNHLPRQWANDVLKLYPAARVLASQKSDFEPHHRKRFLNRIATGDWDVVIVPYSHYGLIRISDDTFNAYLQHELDNLEVELSRARDEAGKNDPSVKELEKAKLNLGAKLRTQAEEQRKDDTLTFEELGVDMLIVDEAHNFKRLFFPTKMTRVAGVPTGKGSQRAFDLFVKSRYLAQRNPTGGTVFLTGTPISNTMAEMFVLMRYLAQPMLDQRGIPQFDGWAATFGEKVTAFEISPTGRGFRQKTRFSRFTNMPELMQMYLSFADVQTADMLKLPTPKLKGGKAQLHVIPATTELNAYVESLLERYEKVLGRRGAKPDPREDNPLKITTDGRKAALDLRLVDEHQPEGGKIDTAGQQIYDLWRREARRKGTQLVFADLGAPNDRKEDTSFTVYDSLRDRLVDLGIPRDDIKFIHEAKTDVQKQALFESVRAGQVRVLMGSTEKMGAGMNVQDRLVALHHLDAPWRPSDIEQREGRILRQGNLFGDKELKAPEFDKDFAVEIHTYLSERSFDAYLWQLLESKARFIMQALKGDATSREMDDADDIVLSFGAAKAVATGNPAIMEHAKAQSDLARLEISESNHDRRRWRLQKQVASLPEQIEGWAQREQDARALVAAIALPEKSTALSIRLVGGQVVTGDEAVAAVMDALDRSQKGPKKTIDGYHTAAAPATVGQVAGVEVRVWTSTSFVSDTPTVTQHWLIAAGDAELTKPATIGSGALQSLYSFLGTGPQKALEQATTELATLRGSLEAARTQVDKPFPHAQTVKDLRTTIKTLEASLNLDKASLAKEAADAGTIVTTTDEDAADAKAERARESAEDGDLPDEATPGESTSPPPPKRGTTLQSTILPGAAEFGEHILEPALKVLVEEVRKNHADLIGLFAPDLSSPSSVRAAGIMRANLAARDQRQQRARRSLRAVEKMMDGWTHPQSMTFWDAMEGLTDLDTLDADTRAIAELYRGILDTYRTALLKRDLIKHYLEHYWGHEWVRGGTPVEQAVRRLFGRRPIQGPESFRKKRSIPTMRDGIDEFHLEPLSWNPTTQLLRKLHEMNKSIAWADMKRELKARGDIKFVPATKKPPAGWTRLPDALGVVYGPNTFTLATGGEARIPFGKLVAGYYYAPPEVARLLVNHMSPGLRGKSALYDLYRTVGNFLNQLQLSFSAFHMMMTGMESVVSKQSLVFEAIARGQFVPAAKAQAQVPIAPILHVFRGHKALKAFYAHDANAAALDDLVGQIVNAGGGFGWDLFEHQAAPEAFMQHLRAAGGAAKAGEPGRALAETAKAAWRTLPALVELTAKPIMELWVPRLKIAAFLDLAAMELETLGPEPDLEEARRVLGAAWDSIDNRFGELRYDNLFWNNALKDLGMASVRALGWNIGTVREMFGVLPAQVKQLGVGRGGPPQRRVNTGVDTEGEPTYAFKAESRLHRKTAWFVAMVFAYGLAGAIYMYLKTGQRPTDLKDYFFPQNGQRDRNGQPVRVSIAGYFKDLYHVLHALPGSAVETAKAKVHPLLTLLADILTNEDFFGREIRNADDPLVTQVGDVLRFVVTESTPIAVQQGTVESLFGITKAPASVTRSAMETYLHGIAPPAHQTKEQATRTDERRALREAVRSGTPAAPTPHLTPMAKRQAARSALQSGNLYAFQRASFSQALHAYTLGTPDERAQVRGVLMKKLPAALSGTPPAERAAVMTAYRAALALPWTAPKAAVGY